MRDRKKLLLKATLKYKTVWLSGSKTCRRESWLKNFFAQYCTVRIKKSLVLMILNILTVKVHWLFSVELNLNPSLLHCTSFFNSLHMCWDHVLLSYNEPKHLLDLIDVRNKCVAARQRSAAAGVISFTCAMRQSRQTVSLQGHLDPLLSEPAPLHHHLHHY